MREISALVGAPLLVLLVVYGGEPAFFLLVALSAGLSAKEMSEMFQKAERALIPIFTISFPILFLFPFYLKRYEPIIFLLFLLVFILLCSTILNARRLAHSIEASANTLFCVIYISFCLGPLILIRSIDEAGFHILFVLAVTWSGDTLAYYVGKYLGKRPLAPKVSPKKTVEGSVGGMAGSLIAGLLMRHFFLTSLSLTDCLTVSVLCGLFGQLGDLAESAIKRGLNANDSGTIIPGHGGILDRIDGLLISGPVFYLYFRAVIT